MEFLRDTVTHRVAVSNLSPGSFGSATPLPSSSRPSTPKEAPVAVDPDNSQNLFMLDSQLPTMDTTQDDALLNEFMSETSNYVGEEQQSSDEEHDRPPARAVYLQPEKSQKKTTSPSPMPSLPTVPLKRKRKSKGSGEVELEILAAMQEIHHQRLAPPTVLVAAAESGKPVLAEELFCRMVCETLERLGKRTRADAKLNIKKVLVNAEFPSDTTSSFFNVILLSQLYMLFSSSSQ